MILAALRAQYSGQRPGPPATDQWPPLEWINLRLQELKQPWTLVRTGPGLVFQEASH